MRKNSRRLISLIALLLVAACNDDDDGLTGPSSTVQTVAVIPEIFTLVVGDTLRLTPLARSAIGNPIVGRAVTWTSSSEVVTVSATGVVTAVRPGSTTITATVQGIVGTAVAAVGPSYAATPLASVTGAGLHTCALTTTGAAHCWGRGDFGQLGVRPPEYMCSSDFSTVPCSIVPVPVDGGLVFQQLAGGTWHTCGLTSDGTVYCWGYNTDGQLGDSSTTNRNAPVAVATTLKFASIDAGSAHTCGLTSAGTAYCWGRNDRGQLGDGTTTRRLTPVAVTGGLTFRQLVAGGTLNNAGHTCALITTGEPYCWGANERGQLGRGMLAGVPNPVPVPVSGGLTFSTLATGLSDHVCGLTATGAAHCWGGNRSGELGTGTARPDKPSPVAVSGDIVFARLVTGGDGNIGHTCGLTSTGSAYCWGSNANGAVGDSSTVERTTPTKVVGGLTFSSIDAGSRHTCARATGGAMYCWGYSRGGQLGWASVSQSDHPVKVFGQP